MSLMLMGAGKAEGTAPSVRAAELLTLGIDATDIATLEDATDFIARFVAIINTPASVSTSTQFYLTSNSFMPPEYGSDGAVGARHMLYWLDRLLKRNKVSNGGALDYTDRLSEMAGWGEAAPDNLTDADPLGLVTTLESLLCKVVVVDPDADPAGTNNLDPTTTTGCVRIDRNSTTSGVRCIDNTTAKTTPTQALFNGTDYRYKFWNTLADLNERAGGGRRFPTGGATCFMLVRNAVAKHEVNVENRLAATLANQAAGITIRGYPGEMPQVWCGNSADSDVTPALVPNPTLTPTNSTSTIFVISPASDAFRNNVHFRDIHFHGKRETAGGDWIFAESIFDFTAHGSGHSVRHCKFTDCQPIQTGDYNAVAFPNLVDFAFAHRTASILLFNTVRSGSADFVFDSNEFEPVAAADWPNDDAPAWTIATSQDSGGKIQFTTTAPHDVEANDIIIVADSHTGWTGETKIGRFTVGSVGADTITTTSNWPGGTGGVNGTLRVAPIQSCTGATLFAYGGAPRITRNTFKGVKQRTQVLCQDVNGLYVADNNFKVGCGISLQIQELSSNWIVERNRFYGWGRDFDGNGPDNGGAAIVPDGDTDIVNGVIRNNVFHNAERMANSFVFGVWTKRNISGLSIIGNLFYRVGLFFDCDDDGVEPIVANADGNLFVGMPENLKIRSAGKYNALIRVNFEGMTGDVPGTLVSVTLDGNQVWRFADATPDQATIEAGAHLQIRNASDNSDPYEADDVLAGWTNNFAAKPDWAGDPETGDLRLTTTLLSFAGNMPFTEALSQAWEAD